MYLSDYLVFILALLACMVFSMIAGGKVKSAYSAYSRVPCRSGLSGRETAERLLRMNGVYDIALGRVSGELTDHYAPNQSIVNLSTGTADSRSVAAAAVAAHEIGHVMQNKEGYGPYRVRTALVPVVNFGSRLAMPLVLIGILLDTYVRTANPDTGFYVAMVGVVLYGGSFLFSLVTLPVELDASRRAGERLSPCEKCTSSSCAPRNRAAIANAQSFHGKSMMLLMDGFRLRYAVMTRITHLGMRHRASTSAV